MEVFFIFYFLIFCIGAYRLITDLDDNQVIQVGY